MSFESCFLCELPVLEMTGQFASLQRYMLRPEDDDVRNAKAYGHCHLSCLVGSQWGLFWGERRAEHLVEVQKLKVLYRGGDLTIVDNPAGERTALRADGMEWTFGPSPARQVPEGGLFALDEEWSLELEDQREVDRIRSELKRDGRSSLLLLAGSLGVQDRLLHREHLEDAHLAFDEEVGGYWKGLWISSRVRYQQLVPRAVLDRV